MNKNNITVILIALAVGLYFYMTNEKTKIRKVFNTIETQVTQGSPPPAIKLALKVSTLFELLHQDFELVYEQKDVFFEITDKQQAKPYLPMALTRAHDFELKIDISEITVNDDQAFVKLSARARGKVRDYSEMFSEQRDFRVQLTRPKSKWLILKIENIENESLNY